MKLFKEYVGTVIGPSAGHVAPVADLGDTPPRNPIYPMYSQKNRGVTKSDIDQLERYADKLFAAVGIDVEFTRHFMNRVNDPRNMKQITPAELVRLFKQTYKKYGKKIAKMTDQANAVINDMKTDINMPFVIDVKGGKVELVAKTVMRKKGFMTSSPKLSFEQFSEEPRVPRKKGQPAGSDKHSDLYTDENPRGTIHGLGFKDVETARASVKKIEGSGKTHAHKIQAAIAMEQRAKVMGKKAEAAVYRAYIEKMKKKTKEMNEKAPDTSDAMKRYKAGKAGFTDIAHLKAKGLIKRADGTKRKSAKYEDVRKKEMNEDEHGFKCPAGYKFDSEIMQCVPKKSRFKTLRYFPYFISKNGGSSNQQSDQPQSGNGAGNGQSGNGNGAGNGNGNGGGNGGGGGNNEVYLAADVRKMPGGGYGVFADVFKNGKRVMTPGGKHKKELKKVYKNEKDANDYMAAIMIAKGGG